MRMSNYKPEKYTYIIMFTTLRLLIEAKIGNFKMKEVIYNVIYFHTVTPSRRCEGKITVF